jgi:hypothetical protein
MLKLPDARALGWTATPSTSIRSFNKKVTKASSEQEDTRLDAPITSHRPVSMKRSNVIKGALLSASAAWLAVPSSSHMALPAAAAVVDLEDTLLTPGQVVLRTLSDCQLAVSVYPTFSYNAAGGGGRGTAVQQPDGKFAIEFLAEELLIPALSYSTTKILGVPLPPPLKIEILPKKLAGTIDPKTGVVELEFDAMFSFTASSLYQAPLLSVQTMLTTEASDGELQHARGQRLNADGFAKLVGVARVPPVKDGLLDTFLMLPTDALAVLSAELKFS